MGESVGRYALERKLAVGGMAEVWLARAQGPGGFSKQVVVKRVLDHLVAEPSFMEMFQHEAALVAQLDHPHIVQLFDFGEQDGTHYLAMEYVDGPSLQGLLKAVKAAGGGVPLEMAARLMAQACEGMAYAHEAKHRETGEPLGLVHRDISPDNLLLSRAGVLKVSDFGIARSIVQRHRTKTGMVKGKVSYMAPEQLMAEPLDGRADVYALGVVLYELLTLSRPFDATGTAELMRAVVSEPAVPVRQRRAGVPAELAGIAEQALEKDRELRFADCREMQRALEGWLLGAGKAVSAWDVAKWVEAVQAGKAEVRAEDRGTVAPPSQPAAAVPVPATSAAMPPAPPAEVTEAWGRAASAFPRAGVAVAAVAAGALALGLWTLPWHEPEGTARGPASDAHGFEAAQLDAVFRAARALDVDVRDGGTCAGTKQARTLVNRFAELETRRGTAMDAAGRGALLEETRKWMEDARAECSVQEKHAAQWKAQERWLVHLVVRMEKAEPLGPCTKEDIRASRAALDEALQRLVANPALHREPPPPEAVAAATAAEKLLPACSVREEPAGRAAAQRSPARERELAQELQQGLDALRERKPGFAVSTFRNCVGMDADYAPCWRGLAQACVATKEWDAAARAYRRYLELVPAAPDAPKIRKQLEAYGKTGVMR